MFEMGVVFGVPHGRRANVWPLLVIEFPLARELVLAGMPII